MGMRDGIDLIIKRTGLKGQRAMLMGEYLTKTAGFSGNTRAKNLGINRIET